MIYCKWDHGSLSASEPLLHCGNILLLFHLSFIGLLQYLTDPLLALQVLGYTAICTTHFS